MGRLNGLVDGNHGFPETGAAISRKMGPVGPVGQVVRVRQSKAYRSVHW